MKSASATYRYLSCILVLMLSVCANHCFFEEFIGDAEVYHAEMGHHHAIGHHAAEQGEEHQHGQSHNSSAHDQVYMRFEAGRTDLTKLPVAFLPFSALLLFFTALCVQAGSLQSNAGPVDPSSLVSKIRHFIYSLSLAPQAPPVN